MKTKYIFSTILFTSIMFFCFLADAEEVNYIITARNHIKNHSIIQEIIIDEMTATLDYSLDEICSVSFHYFPFSETVITIYFSHDGIIVDCNCCSLTEEKYQKDLDYVFDVYEAAQATAAWEDKFGPSLLWDVETNASFWEQYHHLPRETQVQFEQRTENQQGYSRPPEDHLVPDEALVIANRILKEHFDCDENRICSLRFGIGFIEADSEKPSLYIIQYYSGDNETLDLEYQILLCSKDGLCYAADYRKYQFDGRNYDENDPVKMLDGYYWSEYFDLYQLVVNDELVVTKR